MYIQCHVHAYTYALCIKSVGGGGPEMWMCQMCPGVVYWDEGIADSLGLPLLETLIDKSK